MEKINPNKPFNEFFKTVWDNLQVNWIDVEDDRRKRRKIKKDARRYFYIYWKFKEARGNNTKFLQRFYETACKKRGQEVSWENIKEIMKEYKPSTILRSRRHYINPTQEQLNKQSEYINQYK